MSSAWPKNSAFARLLFRFSFEHFETKRKKDRIQKSNAHGHIPISSSNIGQQTCHEGCLGVRGSTVRITGTDRPTLELAVYEQLHITIVIKEAYVKPSVLFVLTCEIFRKIELQRQCVVLVWSFLRVHKRISHMLAVDGKHCREISCSPSTERTRGQEFGERC